MEWNWQQRDWPNFCVDQARLAHTEATFLKQGGVLIGVFKHLTPPDERELTAEVMTGEAMTTSAIEGEILDRQSVRASILKHLGAQTEPRRIGDRERGITEMTMDVLRTSLDPLSDEILFRWHRSLMQGRTQETEVGTYRTHADPMQIVSGRIGGQRVHYEAPPSASVPVEMEQFMHWFNGSRANTPPLTRSAIAHIYFESIHPFEDGNGRIGRAIAEKALAQGLGHPSFSMLASEIESRHSEYYAALESASHTMDVTAWCLWFADVVLAAQQRTQTWLEFLLAKTKLLDALRGQLNVRQEKVLLRMFREGPSGFSGGLSAGNYQTITGASPATAGRDLSELVALGALRKSGIGKGTRYELVIQR